MENSKFEFRALIKFLPKEGCAAKEYMIVYVSRGVARNLLRGQKRGSGRLGDGSPPAGSRGRARWESGAPEDGDTC